MANGGRRMVKAGLTSRGLARGGCFAAGGPIGGAELKRRECRRGGCFAHLQFGVDQLSFTARQQLIFLYRPPSAIRRPPLTAAQPPHDRH
jgi:hypothetical protein